MKKEPNIHEVCSRCKNKCKDSYSFWTGEMPNEIYCDNFKEKKKYTKEIEKIFDEIWCDLPKDYVINDIFIKTIKKAIQKTSEFYKNKAIFPIWGLSLSETINFLKETDERIKQKTAKEIFDKIEKELGLYDWDNLNSTIVYGHNWEKIKKEFIK